jgi:acyl carrier protein
MLTFDQTFHEVVLYLRQEFQLSKDVPITAATSITRTLKIDTDDITFILIPDLEKRFKKNLSIEKWAQIETVEQIARAFSELR